MHHTGMTAVRMVVNDVHAEGVVLVLADRGKRVDVAASSAITRDFGRVGSFHFQLSPLKRSIELVLSQHLGKYDV
jgi:hypothetical protein